MSYFKQILNEQTKISKHIKKILAQYWQRFIETNDATYLRVVDQFSKENIIRIINFWGGSDFAAELCIQNPKWLLDIINSKDEQLPQDISGHLANLTELLQDLTTEQQLMSLLRYYRNKEMLRIIWIHNNQIFPMETIVKDLSALADACVTRALNFLYKRHCQLFGTPISSPAVSKLPIQQYLIVIALGKLGSYELNLSSDIDLIFTYHNNGDTQGTSRSITNQIFFTKLSQRLIHVLNHVNDQGFVFRVDIRLRPYGDSGPIVMSFNEVEQYYQDHGRSWERYAVLKARIIAGDFIAGNSLLKKLKPFIFRKYLDFSNVQALRSIKTQIQHEVKLKQMENNIKLGSGGIREIEFIIQSYQLIYGGRDSTLQVSNTMKALDLLDKKKYLPKDIAKKLHKNYIFLRNLEHSLQALADQQTQKYPKNHKLQERIALSMDYLTVKKLNDDLSNCKLFVSKCFDKIITKPITSKDADILEEFSSIWLEKLSSKAANKLLASKNFQQTAEILRQINLLKASGKLKNVRRQSQERLDKFIPLLLKHASCAEKPDLFFLRVLLLVEAVLKRTAYLVLLIENPETLKFLGYVFSKSLWVTEQITSYPQLLDDLLSIDRVDMLPDRPELEAELRKQLAMIANNDLDSLMESLRHFKIFHLLRINIAQITHSLPLMKISDYLTWLAETIIEFTLKIAWENIVELTKIPIDEATKVKNFIIIAYGKLGGIESSPASDLDLVFIYDNKNGQQDNNSYHSNFFTKLSHRITHILSTRTISGKLYDVDTRLRPSGADGLLVSSIKGFEDYQYKLAWLWEHQALVRARVIAGDQELAEKFYRIKKDILCIKRDENYVYNEILLMRKKIKTNYKLKNKRLYAMYPADTYFNLKYSDGGIIDIEFYMQMLVLMHAHKYESLIKWTDNIRIIETLESLGLITAKQAKVFIIAYKYYRSIVNYKDLNKEDYFIKLDKIASIMQPICFFWNAIEQKINTQ